MELKSKDLMVTSTAIVLSVEQEATLQCVAWEERRSTFWERWRQIPHGQLPVTRASTAPPKLEANTALPQLPDFSTSNSLIGNQTPSHKLHMMGLEIGSITWTSTPVANGVITKGCLEKSGWENSNNGEPVVKAPDKLWRTLVADRGPEGENPPPWYLREALHCMALATNNGHINTSGLLEQRDDKIP
jgi:hypothetical protein